MAARAIGSGIENVPHMTAFYDAMLLTLQSIDIGVVLVQIIDYAPSGALPFLAQQYDVLGDKGWNLCDNDDQRRDLLKSSVMIHKILGTPASIENAIRAVGFKDAIVTERTGILYNDLYKYDGSKRYGGWRWYDIAVEVFYEGDAPTAEKIALVSRLINKCKSTRSVLFDLFFTKVIVKDE